MGFIFLGRLRALPIPHSHRLRQVWDAIGARKSNLPYADFLVPIPLLLLRKRGAK
jgi:hypothetical protein